MSYITYNSKTVHCPYWDIDISIRGKYRYTDNPDNPREAKLCHTECEIIENSKLPVREQKDELKLMRCCKSDCEFLHCLPKIIGID